MFTSHFFRRRSGRYKAVFLLSSHAHLRSDTTNLSHCSSPMHRYQCGFRSLLELELQAAKTKSAQKLIGSFIFALPNCWTLTPFLWMRDENSSTTRAWKDGESFYREAKDGRGRIKGKCLGMSIGGGHRIHGRELAWTPAWNLRWEVSFMHGT